MIKKVLYLPLLFLLLILLSCGAYALPAQNVEIITNQEYFQEVHQALEKANESIQITLYSFVSLRGEAEAISGQTPQSYLKTVVNIHRTFLPAPSLFYTVQN